MTCFQVSVCIMNIVWFLVLDEFSLSLISTLNPECYSHYILKIKKSVHIWLDVLLFSFNIFDQDYLEFYFIKILSK